MWGSIIEAVYKNKFNLIITALILLVLVILVLPRVDSVGGVKFTRRQSGIEKMQADVSDGYWQVYRDAKREAKRTNVFVEAMAYNQFKTFAGDSAGSCAEVYRLLVHSVLAEIIEDFTVSTVFRNHFPTLSDTQRVEEHTTRIAHVGIQLSRSHIQELWRSLLPTVNGVLYERHLVASGFDNEVARIKKESLVRTEVRKMETINNLISVYPELTEQGIKTLWSTK